MKLLRMHPGRSRNRRWTALLALALAAVASLAIAPAQAQAAPACGGSLIGSIKLAPAGQWDVYLENGTTNCVVFRVTTTAYGTAKWMGLGVGVGGTTYTCMDGTVATGGNYDCGNFHSFAGPVRVYAPHKCINLWSRVDFPVMGYTYEQPGVFCG